ncbi:MAG: 4,5-DOPA dioxygenase extradiol [Candidatus Omnitrophota bacterium]
MKKPRMPVLFVGHGSPMNALEKNPFTRALSGLAAGIPRPRAILCLSAHWETSLTQVLVKASPETIHDFYGFPDQLNRFLYPAPGAVTEARQTLDLLSDRALETDAWGLDHGAWTMLTHLYPRADIPVFQVSLGHDLSMAAHIALGRALAPLRDEGILILGSGNIVHNLGMMDPDARAKPYDWAEVFDAGVKKALMEKDIDALASPKAMGRAAASLSLPSDEHYIPLLYAAGASSKRDKISFPYEGIEHASLSMRAVLWREE